MFRCQGPAIVQMVECIMGAYQMRRGLADYVAKFASKNAQMGDMLAALQPYAPAKVNLTNVMKPWLYLNTQPLITVQRDGNSLKLTQSRYIGNKTAPNDR